MHLDELMCDSTALNILRAGACLSFCCVLASWVILTTIYNLGSVDHDLHHLRRTIQVRHGTDRRGLTWAYPQLTEGCRKHKGCDCAGWRSADFSTVLEEVGGQCHQCVWFYKIQRTWGMKGLTDFFRGMMRTSERQLGVLRSVKISYPILVIFHSSLVIICFYPLCYKIWYEFVGFSNPVYAEVYVKMHGFNIRLGEPSEGNTHYNLTFLHRCFTRKSHS